MVVSQIISTYMKKEKQILGRRLYPVGSALFREGLQLCTELLLLLLAVVLLLLFAGDEAGVDDCERH